MPSKWNPCSAKILIGTCLAVLFAAVIPFLSLRVSTTAQGDSSKPASQQQPDPWASTQVVQPTDLLKELAGSKGAGKPIVVCVGFRPLYEGAHIPGASFHGAASSDQGVADLKQWAQNVPRSANVVLYCGCCPLAHCPNIRPAFVALRDMGFSHLRVLLLPNDFATDWVAKGYPVEKGK